MDALCALCSHFLFSFSHFLQTDKVAVAASSSPSAAKPPEPGCIVCRICDQKIPEPEFDRHCETCHVLSAWVLQLDICDKNLGKVRGVDMTREDRKRGKE